MKLIPALAILAALTAGSVHATEAAKPKAQKPETEQKKEPSRRKKVHICAECGKPETECECEGENHDHSSEEGHK